MPVSATGFKQKGAIMGLAELISKMNLIKSVVIVSDYDRYTGTSIEIKQQAIDDKINTRMAVDYLNVNEDGTLFVRCY